MEKKYLMLIPLAIPLFFGGKAAVTAIKKKSGKLNGDHKTKSSANTVTLDAHSGNHEITESDKHIDEIRGALDSEDLGTGISHNTGRIENASFKEIKSPVKVPPKSPDEEEMITNPAGAGEKKLQGEDEPGRMTLRGEDDDANKDPLEGKQIFTGPKGGKYFINDAGKKIYLKS